MDQFLTKALSLLRPWYCIFKSLKTYFKPSTAHAAATSFSPSATASTNSCANVSSKLNLHANLNSDLSLDSESSKLIYANRLAFWIPGFALASWSPLIPFVKSNFMLSEQHLGWLLLFPAAGAGSTVVLGPLLLAALGCRNTVRAVGWLLISCLMCITLVNHIWALCGILFVFGLAAESVSLAANLNAVTLERYLARPLLSSMHGMLSLGNVAGVLIVTTMLQLELELPLPVTCSAVLLSLVVLTYCSQIASRKLLSKEQMTYLNKLPQATASGKLAFNKSLEQSASTAITQSASTDIASSTSHEMASTTTLEQSSAHSTRQLWYRILTSPLLWILGLMCLVDYMIEDSMNDWSGIYLTQSFALPLHQAGWGFLAFALMMALSRLVGDHLVAILGRKALIVGGALLTTIGLIVATSAPWYALSIVGFGLVGLGTANITPQCISYAATLKSVPQNLAVFTVNGVGAVGSLFGPVLIGQLASCWSLHHTFLVLGTSIFSVGLLCLCLLPVLPKKAMLFNTQLKLQPSAASTLCHWGLSPNATLAYARAMASYMAAIHAINLASLRLKMSQDWASEHFVRLENPLINWQNFTLQPWTISLEEPPGVH